MFSSLESLYLLGEVVFTITFPVNICCCTMEPAPERIGISERNWNNFKSKLIELFHLIDLAFLNGDRFRIKHEDIHGEPYTGVAERRWFLVSRLGGFNDFPTVDLEELSV